MEIILLKSRGKVGGIKLYYSKSLSDDKAPPIAPITPIANNVENITCIAVLSEFWKTGHEINARMIQPNIVFCLLTIIN